MTKLSASAQTGWEFIEIYLLGPCEGPFTLNPEEITAGRWISPPELQRELRDSPEAFTDAVRLLWAEHGQALLELLSPAKLSRI
jgi:isopentenyldiphosphate isomerase